MISLTSPVKTRAHGWPAGAKLGALCVSSIALFALPILTVQAAVTVVVLLVYSLPGGVFLRYGLRRLRPLWPFGLILLVWHAWTGTPQEGAMVALRMFNAVSLAMQTYFPDGACDCPRIRSVAPLFWGIASNSLCPAVWAVQKSGHVRLRRSVKVLHVSPRPAVISTV